jgi:HK97 family phage portal protein
MGLSRSQWRLDVGCAKKKLKDQFMKRKIFGLFKNPFPFRAAASTPGPDSDYWYQGYGMTSKAGTNISADTAMNISAVFACVRVIAETVGMLPLNFYRRLERGKEKVADDTLYQLVSKKPNPWQTSLEWREMTVAHMALRGKGYSRILRDGMGDPRMLLPLHPDRMQKVEFDTDSLGMIYEYVDENGMTQSYTDRDVLHFKGLSTDGVDGLSVVGAARESMGLAMATESYGARFFSQNATPRIALKQPPPPAKSMSPEAKERLTKAWRKAYAGLDSSHGVAVLESGMDVAQLGISNEDSQFLETRKFQVNDIARWFRMPPHMIQDLERATFDNIEHQSIDFVVHTMMPWFRRFESALDAQIIPDRQSRDHFFEFLVDALLRGDAKTRSEVYKTSIVTGWMTRNEAREKENMNPLEGLDEVLTPMNMGGNPDDTKKPPDAMNGNGSKRFQAVAESAVARVMQIERETIRKALEKDSEEECKASIERFYKKYARVLSDALVIPYHDAKEYCQNRAGTIDLFGIDSLSQEKGKEILLKATMEE